jgi:hypothetical protein
MVGASRPSGGCACVSGRAQGQPGAQHGQHKPAGCGCGVCPRLGQIAECRLCIRIALDDGEQIKNGAGKEVDPGDDDTLRAGARFEGITSQRDLVE